VRTVAVTGFAVLMLALPAAAAETSPSPTWLVQARCIHLKEGPWTANTGNGYYGGMQFAAQTWTRVGGKPDPAFKHPGDTAYPFTASSSEQLYRAWLLWKHDGGTWRSWGAVGASCSSLSSVFQMPETRPH
jgi:resuscitation-promoting factor RpfA